jgi:NADH-quinone oxidoreductase subunit B
MQEETSIKERVFEKYHLPMKVYDAVQYVAGWARKYSIWPIHLVTGCCGPEFMQTSGAEYDMERLGILPFASVRQCDCIMVVGVVSRKMALKVKYLYEQMGDPKYVVAVGACPTGKGPFYDSYAVVRIDDYVPVDVYIPGCPPRPDAIIQGMMLLQEKIQKETKIGARTK